MMILTFGTVWRTLVAVERLSAFASPDCSLGCNAIFRHWYEFSGHPLRIFFCHESAPITVARPYR